MAKWEAVTKAKIPEYLKMYCRILKKEGLSNWSIKISTGKCGGLCMIDSKILWVHSNDLSLFLHEVAHCTTYRYNKRMKDPGGHHSLFCSKYTELVRKYMKPRQDT